MRVCSSLEFLNDLGIGRFDMPTLGLAFNVVTICGMHIYPVTEVQTDRRFKLICLLIGVTVLRLLHLPERVGVDGHYL